MSNPENSRIEEYDFILSVIKSLPNIKTILDVGCGSGELLQFLSQHGYDVSGTDVVDEVITKAQEKKLSVVQSSATDLSIFQQDEFDCVILSHVLHHVSQPIQAITESFRVCKHNCLIVEAYIEDSILFSKNTGILEEKIKALDVNYGFYHLPHIKPGVVLGACQNILSKLKSFQVRCMFSLQELTTENLFEWIERVKTYDIDAYNELKEFIISQDGFANFGTKVTILSKA